MSKQKKRYTDAEEREDDESNLHHFYTESEKVKRICFGNIHSIHTLIGNI